MIDIDVKAAEERMRALIASNSKEDKIGRFNRELGLELIRISRGEDGGAPFVEYKYTAKEGHLNPFGDLHGGIMCSLMDTGMGYGCACFVDSSVNTVTLNASFLRKGTGKNYKIRAEYQHLGRRIINTTSSIYDMDNDELCATGSGTFIVLGVRSWED